jgi:signal transduction histidine kinase
VTGARKNKLAAIGVFALTALVVTAGITWATVATLQLAKRTVMDEHKRMVSEALMLMDVDIKSILHVEAAREYTDYRSQYAARAVAVLPGDNVEIDADVYLPSPLAQRSPVHDWVDLYFQVDPDGIPSSPQVPLEGVFYLPDRTRVLAGCDQRICRTWAWFIMHALPGLDFPEFSGREEPEDASFVGSTALARAPAATSRNGISALREAIGQRLNTTDYQKPKRSFQYSQRQHLPPRECVPHYIADRNIRIEPKGFLRFSGLTPQPGPDVEVKAGRFREPIWLEPEPEEGPKLAFIRDCFQEEVVFHQGFIGDWGRLKVALLDEIKDVFPDADLVPIKDGEQVEGPKLQNLPVRLVVPDASGMAMAAAWKSVGGTLISTWIGAAGVLAIAGIGLRNLVTLMERRMQFAYAVTHELRTPLTTFRLYTDMLSAGLVPDESKQEYLTTLNRESQRLSNLVEDVLEFARLENHKVRLAPTETDAPTLLEALADMHAQRCARDGIEARTENLVSNGQALYVDIDAVNRIAAVLINNACRHARDSERPTVLLRLGAENGHTHLDVIDSGSGIDRSDVHQIFKPFRRGKSATNSAHGGIGLGLALARSWARLLGGRLDLIARRHPEYGGAHFRLTIPSEVSRN